MSLDAYHDWLDIPPAQQPPDHYALLGLDRFEPDTRVVHQAALARIALLRQYQAGPHSDRSQQLMNEVSQARIDLTDPARRAAYDRDLRDFAEPHAGADPADGTADPAPAASGARSFPVVRLSDDPTDDDTAPAEASGEPAGRRRPALLGAAFLAVALVLVATAVLRPTGNGRSDGATVAADGDGDRLRAVPSPHGRDRAVPDSMPKAADPSDPKARSGANAADGPKPRQTPDAPTGDPKDAGHADGTGKPAGTAKPDGAAKPDGRAGTASQAAPEEPSTPAPPPPPPPPPTFALGEFAPLEPRPEGIWPAPATPLNGPADELFPFWRRDLGQLHFARHGGDRRQPLFAGAPDGRRLSRLLAFTGVGASATPGFTNPLLVPDGLALLLRSPERPEAVLECRRAAVADAFGPPEPLLSLARPIDAMTLTPDGLRLWLTAADGTVWQSRRNGPGEVFPRAEPLDLPAGLSHPTIDADESVTVLQGERPDGRQGLFVRFRDRGDWTEPELLAPTRSGLGRHGDVQPALSADGRVLAFASDRPLPQADGASGWNLWLTAMPDLAKQRGRDYRNLPARPLAGGLLDQWLVLGPLPIDDQLKAGRDVQELSARFRNAGRRSKREGSRQDGHLWFRSNMADPDPGLYLLVLRLDNAGVQRKVRLVGRTPGVGLFWYGSREILAAEPDTRPRTLLTAKVKLRDVPFDLDRGVANVYGVLVVPSGERGPLELRLIDDDGREPVKDIATNFLGAD